MTPERADRLRQALASFPGGTEALAVAVVDRLRGVTVHGAVPVDFTGKTPAIAAAITTLIEQSTLGSDLRRDLTRADVPIVPDLKNETLATRIRAEMLGTLRDAAPDQWDQHVADAWHEAVETITSVIFYHASAA